MLTILASQEAEDGGKGSKIKTSLNHVVRTCLNKTRTGIMSVVELLSRIPQ